MGLIKKKAPAAGPRQPKKIELKKFAGSNQIRRNLQNSAICKADGPSPLRRKLKTALRWGAGLALGLLIFFCLGQGLIRGWRVLSSSSYFALKTIDIEGHNRLKSREILETTGLRYGHNTLTLSMRHLGRALAGNPWVEAFSIKRELPDGIHIAIREHEPRYWIRRDGVLTYADERGQPIAPVSAGNFASLPLLEVEAGAERLVESLPLLARGLEHLNFPLSLAAASSIRLTTARALEISLREDLRLVLGLDGWETGIVSLSRVLNDLSRRGELRQAREIRAYGRDVWVSGRAGRT